MKKSLRRALFMILLFSSCLMAQAINVAAQPTKEELIWRLKTLEEMVQRQQQEIQELKKKLQEQEDNLTSQTQKAKEVAKTEAKEVASEEVKKVKEWLPKWIRQTKVSGDLRLRYEGIHNREDGKGLERPDRDQFRLRARLFFDGNISDELSAHFMLSSNQDTNKEATTTNQTFTDDFNDKGIYIHRAYGVYRPKWLEGLELVGGKFKNTFLHTDIMWDPDVNPEGFYEKYEYKGFGRLIPFVQLGQMSVNEVKDQTDDAWLFIEQLGVRYQTKPFDLTMAISWYDWTNLANTKYLNLAQYKNGGGNTFAIANSKPYTVYGYMYDYNLVEGLLLFTLNTLPYPLRLTFDYIQNTDSNVPENQDSAYYIGFDLGKLKGKYDWLLGYKYARIEKDALLGSMADMDFYGANRKGHKLYFYYKPLERLRVGGAYFVTRPVVDWTTPEKNGIYKDFGRENRIQIDTIFEF
ncbi:MAG: putative porin [Desulfatiglandales bacterium]